MRITLFTDIFTGFLNDLTSELLLIYVVNFLLFIAISTIILLIVSTPVILFYSTIDNYFKWKSNRLLITGEICCKETINHPTYIKTICSQYKKSFSGFIGSLSGLVTWNIGSLLYILITFPDFSTGIVEYFLFPFDVVASYSSSNMMESISQYNSSWLFMILILVATIFSYQLGKSLSILETKNKLLKGFKDFSWA